MGFEARRNTFSSLMGTRDGRLHLMKTILALSLAFAAAVSVSAFEKPHQQKAPFGGRAAWGALNRGQARALWSDRPPRPPVAIRAGRRRGATTAAPRPANAPSG